MDKLLLAMAFFAPQTLTDMIAAETLAQKDMIELWDLISIDKTFHDDHMGLWTQMILAHSFSDQIFFFCGQMKACVVGSRHGIWRTF